MKLKTGTKVTLLDFELELCMLIAKRRQKAADEAGARDNNFTSEKDPVVKHYYGVCGEMAFAKMCNIYPSNQFDTKLKVNSRGTDIDMKLYDGSVVEIKYNTYQRGDLITNYKSKPTSKYHVLIVGKEPDFEFRGAILTTELRVENNIKDYGYGKRYAVPQSKLKDLDV